jgi:hypothetical protein
MMKNIERGFILPQQRSSASRWDVQQQGFSVLMQMSEREEGNRKGATMAVVSVLSFTCKREGRPREIFRERRTAEMQKAL